MLHFHLFLCLLMCPFLYWRSVLCRMWCQNGIWERKWVHCTLHIYNIHLIFCKWKYWNVVPFMLVAEGSSFPFKWRYSSSAYWWTTTIWWMTNQMTVMITDPNTFKASNECKLCMWLGINLKFQINKIIPLISKKPLRWPLFKGYSILYLYVLFIYLYIYRLINN